MGVFGRELFEDVLAAATSRGPAPQQPAERQVAPRQTRVANPSAELENIWQQATAAEEAQREAAQRRYRENTEAVLADSAFLDEVVEDLLACAVENQRNNPRRYGPVASLERPGPFMERLVQAGHGTSFDEELVFEEIARRCNARLAGGHYYAIVQEDSYLNRSVHICC